MISLHALCTIHEEHQMLHVTLHNTVAPEPIHQSSSCQTTELDKKLRRLKTPVGVYLIIPKDHFDSRFAQYIHHQHSSVLRSKV